MAQQNRPADADSLDWAALKDKYPVTLTDKLASLPTAPGCYLMKNARGEVIYVGKAKQLRSRVRSYFQKGADLTRRKRQMVYEIADLDTIATDSEVEALILESNLIKKHHPIYNVRLRDDKSYPYIAITLSEQWPRVVYLRKLRMQPKEKDKYYGPYTDTEAVREMMRLIRRVFGVPCGYKDPSQSRGKACMYYHIGQCTGVCVGKVTHEEYMAVIRDVMAFLEGRRDELVNRMLEQMNEASENLEFEKAARLRDQVQSILKLIARQKVVSTAAEDQDVIALATDNGDTCAEVFFVRGGKLIGQEHFLLQNASADEIEESLGGFIQQYYDSAAYVPRTVLLNADIAERDVIESWLRQKTGSRVQLVTPKRGEKRQLVDMARKNAELILRQIKLKMASDRQRIEEGLEALREAIGMDRLPRRIEAYDISHIQGAQTVASLVVFENGLPKKSDYRKFKIRQSEGQPDDYASMREVISRRLTPSSPTLTGGMKRKGLGEAFAELPDLMLIDGGKGQLNAALEAIVESQESRVESPEHPELVEEPVVIGLAKQHEEIFAPGRSDPIILPRTSKALHLLQRIRDEAHRFAITYHRSSRRKTVRASILNDIPGIGPKRRRALMKHFGSVERIKQASVDELAAAPSMTKQAAEAVYGFFRQEE